MSCAKANRCVCVCVCSVVCNEHALLIWMRAVRREMSMCSLVWNKSLHFLCVHDFVTGPCVRLSKGRETRRERKRSPSLNASLPFMNIQAPPTSHWCPTHVCLRVGKGVVLVTELSQSWFYWKKNRGDTFCRSSFKGKESWSEARNKVRMSEMVLISCGTLETRAALRSHV